MIRTNRVNTYSRSLRLATSIIALSLVGCAIYRTPRIEGTVIDSDGKPVTDAYVAYAFLKRDYAVTNFYWKPGKIIRTNEKGEFRIPASFAKRKIKPFIFAIYSPRLHSAVSNTPQSHDKDKAVWGQDGFLIDNHPQIYLKDASNNLYQRFACIQVLSSANRFLGDSDPAGKKVESTPLKNDLSQAFKKEVQEFAMLTKDLRTPVPRDFKPGALDIQKIKYAMAGRVHFNRTRIDEFAMKLLGWQRFSAKGGCCYGDDTEPHVIKIFNSLLTSKELYRHANEWDVGVLRVYKEADHLYKRIIKGGSLSQDEIRTMNFGLLKLNYLDSMKHLDDLEKVNDWQEKILIYEAEASKI